MTGTQGSATKNDKNTGSHREAGSQDGNPGRSHHHGHSGHQDHRFTDPAGMAESWNDPERDKWQHPEKIVKAMGVKPGMVVADIGAGTGYFLPFLLKAVGEEGRVIAVDIEPGMVKFLNKMKRKRGWKNLDVVLTKVGKAGLKAGSVDRILMVNTWHHVPSRIAYATHLAERIRKGGSVWIVDFLKGSPMGPPVKYRLPPKQVASELQSAGFKSGVHELKLPRQFLVYGK